MYVGTYVCVCTWAAGHTRRNTTMLTIMGQTVVVSNWCICSQRFESRNFCKSYIEQKTFFLLFGRQVDKLEIFCKHFDNFTIFFYFRGAMRNFFLGNEYFSSGTLLKLYTHILIELFLWQKIAYEGSCLRIAPINDTSRYSDQWSVFFNGFFINFGLAELSCIFTYFLFEKNQQAPSRGLA